MDQLELGVESVLQDRRFSDWLRQNPRTFEQFCRFALEAIRARRKIGAKAIAERVRWECTMARDAEGFSVNNTFVAPMARLFEERFPEHRGYFEHRRRGIERRLAFAVGRDAD